MKTLDNKLAICHTFCGQTYRDSCIDKLKNKYSDNKEVYYFVITDDTKPFNNIKRKNLIVKNLKEFYPKYPHLEKYEYFLESSSIEDYVKKFREQKYRFPFSTNRFHLDLASEYNIKNVALMATDSFFEISNFKKLKFRDNIIYNLCTHWDKKITEKNMNLVTKVLERDFNLKCSEIVRIYDAACKLFCFSDIKFMLRFLKIWDHVLLSLYKSNDIKKFQGSYAVNNEYILGPIYNALKIKGPPNFTTNRSVLSVIHNKKKERFWA